MIRLCGGSTESHLRRQRFWQPWCLPQWPRRPAAQGRGRRRKPSTASASTSSLTSTSRPTSPRRTPELRWLVSQALADAADDGSDADPAGQNDLKDRLERKIRGDLDVQGGQAAFTRKVCTLAAQLEIVRAELPAIAAASRDDAADGSAIKSLDFGKAEEGTGDLPPQTLRDAIENVRDGEWLPKRLGRDDPAETTSDLTARIAAHAGFVSVAALQTAKLPAARMLDLLRPSLLAVTGMSARGWLLRIPLVLGFWAAALYLTTRVVQTDGSADLDSIAINEILLALVAATSVIGVATLPAVRGLRRKWRPVAFAEFAMAFGVLAAGGGAAIVAALAFGHLSPGQLIVANGFDEPRDWAVDVALFAILGIPLTGPAVVRWAQNVGADLTKHVAVAAILVTAVSILIGVWMGPDLIDAIKDGPAWKTVSALVALVTPVLICVPYLFAHNVSSGPRSH